LEDLDGEDQAILEQGQDIRRLVENSLQAWLGFREQVIGRIVSENFH